VPNSLQPVAEMFVTFGLEMLDTAVAEQIDE
jgi:hypothetical protein